MTPQELRASILQQAIQGKLVEQRSEEGTGEELLQQIQAEKQALVKAGKIKKEKPLPEITEDEKLYDIPANWTWVRFGELGSYKKGPFGSAITKSMFVPKGNGAIKVYEQKNAIQKDATIGDYYIKREYFESKMIGFEVFPGDIIVSCAGTIGETFVMPEQIEQGIINQALMRMKIFAPLHIPYFLMFFDFALKKDAKSSSKGSAIKNIPPFEILKNYLVPIPPLAEQKRIVAKLEEILPLIDCYEAAWNKLEEFNKRFPGDMQKSILQLAIQGKLVEQRPEEGAGEELFQQILSEKQALIKAGKIKKEKPLPQIAEDEIPFDIPDTWRWVRFSELMNSMSTGPFGSMLHKSDYVENGIPLVNPANIVNGYIIPSDKMMVSPETAKRLETYKLQSGMIIMGRRGEMGRCAVVSEVENGWLCGTGSFFMVPSASIFVYYISTFFKTSYARSYLTGASVGTTMSNLNHKILSNLPVPLPPLAEQKRIVAKLEEILPLCERLK